MRTSDGELLRSFAARPGEAPLAHTPAFLEDYALFVHGLLTLADACRRLNDKASDHYLQAAKSAFEIAERLFRSPDGGYFDTRESQRDVFVRAQSIHDGAIPSASAIMIQSAIELSRLTGDNEYADHNICGAAFALVFFVVVARSVVGHSTPPTRRRRPIT